MARFSLALIGLAAALAAVLSYRNRSSNPNRRIPVQKAADMLRDAWSGRRTVA